MKNHKKKLLAPILSSVILATTFFNSEAKVMINNELLIPEFESYSDNFIDESGNKITNRWVKVNKGKKSAIPTYYYLDENGNIKEENTDSNPYEKYLPENMDAINSGNVKFEIISDEIDKSKLLIDAFNEKENLDYTIIPDETDQLYKGDYKIRYIKYTDENGNVKNLEFKTDKEEFTVTSTLDDKNDLNIKIEVSDKEVPFEGIEIPFNKDESKVSENKISEKKQEETVIEEDYSSETTSNKEERAKISPFKIILITILSIFGIGILVLFFIIIREKMRDD
ncbi:MAG: hypothetical protein Q4B52_05440 [Tissierellia bacterium]|nr:hypothetical protein [Tissierellia bacterium]